MTVDERIERLVERHEALAQSVELTTHNVNQLIAENRQIATENQRRDFKLEKIEKLVSQIAEGIASLVKIVQSHESPSFALGRMTAGPSSAAVTAWSDLPGTVPL